MELVPQFTDFLSNIRLTENQRKDLKTGHETLRQRLKEDEDLSEMIVATFLQGSYIRHTATRPKDESRADVDIIIVTSLSEHQYTPAQAMQLFKPFLEEHYKGKYKFQGRSIGIELSYVDLDIVITSAASEVGRSELSKAANAGSLSLSEAVDWWYTEAANRGKAKPAWKLEPLRIPDRDAGNWEDTHPLEQIAKTRQKNKDTNKHFVNVVKALKWWRRLNPDPKHPKGYPVEHLAFFSCRDGIDSVAEGVVLTLEDIMARYSSYAAAGIVPTVKDHGVDQNVLRRLTVADFQAFMKLVENAASLARRGFDSTSKEESGRLWRDLFGSRFPEPPKRKDEGGEGPDGGYTPRTGPTVVGVGRFG